MFVKSLPGSIMVVHHISSLQITAQHYACQTVKSETGTGRSSIYIGGGSGSQAIYIHLCHLQLSLSLWVLGYNSTLFIMRPFIRSLTSRFVKVSAIGRARLRYTNVKCSTSYNIKCYCILTCF